MMVIPGYHVLYKPITTYCIQSRDTIYEHETYCKGSLLHVVMIRGIPKTVTNATNAQELPPLIETLNPQFQSKQHNARKKHTINSLWSLFQSNICGEVFTVQVRGLREPSLQTPPSSSQMSSHLMYNIIWTYCDMLRFVMESDCGEYTKIYFLWPEHMYNNYQHNKYVTMSSNKLHSISLEHYHHAIEMK